MKNRLFTIILLITGILVGCSKTAVSNDDVEENEHPIKEEVVLSLVEETLTTTSADFILENSGLNSVIFGQGCSVEKKEGSYWVPLPVVDKNAVILLDSFEVESLSKGRFSQNWSTLYGNLAEGRYRIGKKYSKGPVYSFTVYCELEVTKETKQGVTGGEMFSFIEKSGIEQ